MDETESSEQHVDPNPEAHKKRNLNPWNVREALGSTKAMKAYDAYLREHKRRLTQLEREARGEMAPSDWWAK